MSIEVAIRKATGVSAPKRGENRQKFLETLVEKIGALPVDDWDALDEVPGAQDWYNKAAAAYEGRRKILDFDEDTGNNPAASGDEGENEENTVAKKSAKKPVQKAGAKQPEKSAKAKTPAPAAKPSKSAAAPARGNSGGGEGARPTITRQMLKDPNTGIEALSKMLTAKGLKTSDTTISAMRSQYRQMMKIVVEQGEAKKSLLSTGRAARE